MVIFIVFTILSKSIFITLDGQTDKFTPVIQTGHVLHHTVISNGMSTESRGTTPYFILSFVIGW